MDLPTLYPIVFLFEFFTSSFTIIWKQNSLIVRMQLVWSVWSKYPPYETFSSVSTFVHVRPLYVKVIIMHVLFIIAYVDELWTTTRALIDHCFAWERINLNRKWYIFFKIYLFYGGRETCIKTYKNLTFHCV